MEKFVIRGGRRLSGRTHANGAKNSALPIITAAALASQGESILENVPDYTDIRDLCDILRALGAEIEEVEPGTLRVRAAELSGHVAPYELARKLRGSTYVMGLLLARLGRGEVACPGGCDIGARPVDFHLKGFKALGAEVEIERGSMIARKVQLRGNRFYVDRASFGTTINMMITASLAPGTTVLENAAREPEVVDLANFLNSMGARVRGAGTETIRIEGVKRLRGARHEIIPDRLETGTFLIAGALTGGDVTVEGCIPEHLGTVIAKLREAGMDVEVGLDTLRCRGRRPIQPADVETQVYPGFPTDLQSPWVTLMSVADGVSVVTETIFENRFGFTNELIRLGAQIKVDRNSAIIRGVGRLTGAPVEARELRGGVALCLAGLVAEGTTEVHGVRFIDRGYHRIEEKLRSLGADIERVRA
ncbi:UDP-N-acetylglucosamine 1-carboxyvinyltransferase [Caldinitratiruptor microaerophilus]|uniref:UDP-N-acetylglucosamine 1-carboxyvinyltransferase n=1 Tax=Caldinitratiruptor microaerophilus TaxID=671077 RepID=A0AA35GAI4_9FIRM|nr:UDP-N-acetylglucosamine 1-carboxyvinyltransferase [Caldinitratiruptor microaerophilus]BDG61339.1 UDP-N-acetylglucosamine 1-carboxyvinyltransferase 1 [Caldinitratiruptor microaerophilus]